MSDESQQGQIVVPEGGIVVRFKVKMVEKGHPGFGPYGPQFHRWLPDGEKDAIALTSGDPAATLTVWFERRGGSSFEGGPIHFEESRQQVDPETLALQSALDAGPLLGNLALQGVSERERKALHDPLSDDETYEEIVRRIVKAVATPLARFTGLLRTVYGQSWIRTLETWDSRQEEARDYCSRLAMRWSEDGRVWHPISVFFGMRDPGRTAEAREPNHDYRDYLTREAWAELAELCKAGYEPSLAVTILAQAYRLLLDDNLKYAFVEAETALQLAAAERITQFTSGAKDLRKAASPFDELPERTKLVVLAGVASGVAHEDVGLALEAITVRNRIVHEGWNPLPEATRSLRALLRVTSAILKSPLVRLVEAPQAWVIRSPEQWESVYQSQYWLKQ